MLLLLLIVVKRMIAAIDKVDWEEHCFSIVINSSPVLDRGWVQGSVRGAQESARANWRGVINTFDSLHEGQSWHKLDQKLSRIQSQGAIIGT